MRSTWIQAAALVSPIICFGLAAAPAQDTRLERRAASALRQGGRVWEQFLAEQPPEILAPLLVRQQEEIIAQLEPLREKYDRLSVVRESLDEARAHALKLIFDERAYFYPYDPALVGAERARQYAEVQKEVDRRVAKVRELWEGRQGSFRLTGSQHQQLERLRSVRVALAGLGAPEIETWVLSLPAERQVTLQSFCADRKEREQLDLSNQIETFSKAIAGPLTAAERELVTATNAYRRMFGFRPLALNPKLTSASGSHAEEMSKLGYFSHVSPTPGRATPPDRARAAGYDQFGAENLVTGENSALAAVQGWSRSSVHHRNLLDKGYSELGVGNTATYWVQMFGRGQEYRQHSDFPTARIK